MVRDFSETTKKRLLEQIEKVKIDKDAGRWTKALDEIFDVILYIGKYTKLMSIKDDMSNIKAYHKHVVDMTDMKENELKKIFKDVYDIDHQYKQKFENMRNYQELYFQKLNQLSSVIKPDFKIYPAEKIKTMFKDTNNKLEASSKKIDAEYSKDLDELIKNQRNKALKNTFEGTIETFLFPFTAPVKWTKTLLTQGPVAFGVDVTTGTWDLLNSFFKMAPNLGSLLMSLTYSSKGSIVDKEYVLNEMIGVGSENMTDFIESNGGYFKDVSKITERIDHAVDYIKLVTSLKSVADSINSKKFGFDKGIKTAKDATLEIESLREKIVDKKGAVTLYKNIARDLEYVKASNVDFLFSFYKLISDFESERNLGESALVFIAEKFYKPTKALSYGKDAYDNLTEFFNEIMGVKQTN